MMRELLLDLLSRYNVADLEEQELPEDDFDAEPLEVGDDDDDHDDQE